jgi:hypothetical protein
MTAKKVKAWIAAWSQTWPITRMKMAPNGKSTTMLQAIITPCAVMYFGASLTVTIIALDVDEVEVELEPPAVAVEFDADEVLTKGFESLEVVASVRSKENCA